MGGIFMKTYPKLLLFVFLLSFNKFLNTAEQNPQALDLQAMEMKQAEENPVDMEQIQEAANEVAERIANEIPEVAMHDCVMSIENLVKEFAKTQTNNLIEDESKGIEVNNIEQNQQRMDLIERTIAKKVLSLLTPEKMEAISKIVSEKLNIQKQNRSILQKIILIISATAVIKSITYRILGTAISVMNAYFFLRTSLVIALALGGLDIGTKTAAYYLHERAWDPKVYKCLKQKCACCKKHQ